MLKEGTHIGQDQIHKNRPQKVTTAVILLYATLGIGVLRSILEAPRHLKTSPVGFVIFVTLAVLVIMLFLIYMIGRGRNWARITFLILFIIGIPVAIKPMLQSLMANPVSGVLGIGQTILQAAALVFLFQKQSSDWFRHMKSSK